MKRAEFKCQGKEAEVWVYDVIGADPWGDGISAKMFLEDLVAVGEVDRLTVRINSPGGSVFDGNAIYNALLRFPARIEVAVDGVAASAASIVAMAGDNIAMAQNAMMMIHEAYAFAGGTAKDHRQIADVLDKTAEGYITAYMTQSKQDRATIEQWLADETWFTAEEAVAAGMADEVTGVLELAACVPAGRYVHTPAGMVAMGPPAAPPLRRKENEAQLTLVGP